jgi:carbonic anhydrase/acetyltransferase-like protein (isoleucine patch superfamily)
MKALVRSFGEWSPRIAPSAFLAETAVVIGDVTLGEESSVWFGAVLRGDVGFIQVGQRSNVQDLTMLHMSRDHSNTVIGDEVTIGHSVVIHGAKVGDGALIGMGAILMDNVEIGAEALVAAGTLVPPNFVVPPRTLVRGSPGKVIRDLTEEEWRQGRLLAERYVGVAREHERSRSAT